jgi:hypothetical protein
MELGVLTFSPRSAKENANPTNISEGTMSDRKVHNYEEHDAEREEGHVDTRGKNFECDRPDPALGCDPGIDVQG